MIICDSNVFFAYFRGDEKVAIELASIGFSNLYLSAVTVGETYYGMRKGEKRKTTEFVNSFGIIHLDKEISLRFTQLMLAYQNQKIAIPDCLIAATTIVCKAKLFTFNRQDFDYIKGVKLYNPTQSFP